MSPYKVPYYNCLRYYRTMQEMELDWWYAEASQDLEAQSGQSVSPAHIMTAIYNLTHQLRMLDEAIEDYENLVPCRGCGADRAWGPLAEFTLEESPEGGPIGARTCESCGHREEFFEADGYGEEPEEEWELERFLEVVYAWLKRFSPALQLGEEDPKEDDAETSPE
jgi:hypothetical protein